MNVNEDNLRDATKANVTLPIYQGVGPSGSPTYFIITEASTPEAAETFGAILSPKLRYGALPSAEAAAQYVTLNDDGRIVFRGDVDFSPERILEMGEDDAFPPLVAQPGAVGDDEYSSLVVLPSGLVINAQIIANATGNHDHLNDINIEERSANFQLLDGWQGGSRYYYHLVTDASDPVPAAIELGVYAPRLANLPVFGQSGLDGETVLLGFSPNINGLSVSENSIGGINRQGLGSTITDQDLDPVNIFPFDPDNSNENNNYSPFWDAHLNMWTDEAINGPDGDQRRAITRFADLRDLRDQGLITSFTGSTGIENSFVAGLRASNAVINCPVILQPFEDESEAEALAARTPAQEATTLVTAAALGAEKTVDDFSGANRTFSSDLNVFLPSTISIDMENLRDNENANATLPLYKGVGPEGEDVYYILTEASTLETAEIFGAILAPKLRYGALGDDESVLLGFSPNINGLTTALDGVDLDDLNRQGLSSTILDDDRDPVNVFPFDPDNSNPQSNYSPMWDLHLSMWTDEAINGPAGDQRRAIRSFADLASLVEQGLVTSFSGSTGPENAFVAGLRETNAIINCPVILQPFEGETEVP